MRIALIGTYSSLNKGDFAMHQALIKEISKRIDNVTFDIFSPFPELDSIRYLYYFNSCQINCKKNLFTNPLYNIYSNLLAYIKCYHSLDIYDAIIDVSGDTMGESYTFQNTIYHILYLNLFKNMNKKIILAPQSVGPFTYSKYFFKNIFRYVEKIYVRDPLSYKYLQCLELENISMTGDLAFLLNRCEYESNRYYLWQIRNMYGIKIGLNLSYLIGKYAKTDIDMIRFGTKLCILLYSKFSDVNIVFIPHVFGPEEKKNDSIIGKLIYENLPIELKDRFIFINNEMNHEELKAIISEMDLFIGARMHACIGAISTATPFINITYSDKSIGLISQYLELPKLCIDIRTEKNENDIINKILVNIENLWNDKENIRNILAIRSIDLKEKADKSIDDICKIIQK